jgi:chitin disaccharide deacetylase
MNTLLSELGFGPADRVVIVHADDIGAYQGSLPAIDDLFSAGLLSSCATMTPCPWFPAVADWARRNPTADIGLHATLTAEYAHYRWGPLSTRDPASGLIDADGYFHHTTAAAQGASPDAVHAEHVAQMARALAAGIDITHVDSHMGASFHPAFLGSYMATGASARVPNFVPRVTKSGLGGAMAAAWIDQWLAYEQKLEAQGLPLVDHVAMMPLHEHTDRIDAAKRVFDALPAGLSYLLLHPAIDTPEMRALTPGDWQARVADHAAFCAPELHAYVRDTGVQVIGWRVIRDALRARAA